MTEKEKQVAIKKMRQEERARLNRANSKPYPKFIPFSSPEYKTYPPDSVALYMSKLKLGN